MSALTSAIAASRTTEITQEQINKIEADQKQTIIDLQTQVTTLNTEVKTLMDQLRSTMDQLTESNGLVQHTKEIYDDPNKQSTSAVQKSIGKAKANIKSVPATNMNK